MNDLYNLKEFKFNGNKDSINIITIGCRNNYIIKYLFYKKQKFSYGLVKYSKKYNNNIFKSIMPNLYIYDKLNYYLTNTLLKYQQKNYNYLCDNEYDYKISKNSFLVLDIINDEDIRYTYNDNIKNIHLNSRKYKMLNIISMPYPYFINPVINCNTDYIFIYKNTDIPARIKLYDYYIGIFQSFNIFCHIMDKYTNNNNYLVIDNTINSNNIEDRVFWFKPDEDIPDYNVMVNNIIDE